MKVSGYVLMIWSILVLMACQTEEKRSGLVKDIFVPEDLEITLWAESPLFYNPTAMDVDIKGRIWVSEAVNYRTFKNKGDSILHHEKGDRIVILEDTDGDGVADRSTVFVQDKDLHSPVGIAVIGNQVIVSSAPNMIIYTDTDGDDKADKKEVFLTGFGGYDHDHSLHSVIAGPDGRWYFNTGNAGPHIVTDRGGWTLRSGSFYTGGTPYNKENTPGMVSDDGRVWTGGLALSMTPEGKDMEVYAHNFRNSYEVTMDSYGDMWQNDNDDEVSTCRVTWVMENGNAGYASRDGSRSWRADMRPGQSMFTAHWHQEDPGVMPAGDNTGAGAPTGIVRYESDLLGEKYRGMLLSADAGRNVIFGYHPEGRGSGYELTGNRFNFVTSVQGSTENYRWNDMNIDSSKYFRPSDVTVGADGAVYVADWYDPIVGGHAMHDTGGYGRIYRIGPKGEKLTIPAIDLNTAEGQMQALLSPAINVRNSGFLKLKSRGEEAVPDIAAVIEKDENPFHVARAIWLMGYLGNRGLEYVRTLLTDREEKIRLVAFRTLRVTDAERLLEYAGKLADDPSPTIRREVAVSLRDVPLGQSMDIVNRLSELYDGEDPWYPEALGTALEKKESEYYRWLERTILKNPVEWPDQIFNLVWRLHPEEAAGDLAAIAGAKDLNLEKRKKAMTGLGFIPTREAAARMMEIRKGTENEELKEAAIWWLNFRSGNDWAGFYKPEIKGESIPEEVKAWEKQLVSGDTGMEEKKALIRKLAESKAGGRILIGLASSNYLTAEMKEEAGKYIFRNPDQTVRVMAGEYFKNQDAGRNYSIPAILKMKGNEAEGEKVFRQHCATCHTVSGEGANIGPDLTNVGRKLDGKALLDAIVFPDADVVFGYEAWKVKMKDGKMHYGFIQSEGAYITLRDIAGKQIQLPSGDIESREAASSLMPDPGTMGIEEQELADIATYLLNIK